MNTLTEVSKSRRKDQLLIAVQIALVGMVSVACGMFTEVTPKDKAWIDGRTEELKKKGYKADEARNIAQEENREAAKAASNIIYPGGRPDRVKTPTLDQHIGHPEPPPAPHVEHHQF